MPEAQGAILALIVELGARYARRERRGKSSRTGKPRSHLVVPVFHRLWLLARKGIGVLGLAVLATELRRPSKRCVI